LRFFNFHLPAQNSKQVGVATFQQRNQSETMSKDGFDGFENRFLVSQNNCNNCIKTIETKLKPVSVSLNRMRHLDLQKVCDAAYFRFLISLRLLVGLASRRGKNLFFAPH